MIKRLFAAATIAVGLLGASQALACPNWNNPTVFGTGNINGGYSGDVVFNITAGGRTDLSRCNLNGQNFFGWVVNRPDLRINYQGPSSTNRLTFELQTDNGADPILLVNAPDGSWFFNDDFNGDLTVSLLDFIGPLSGQYDLWFGTYNRSSNNPAVLLVYED
jgi:hypothetical protein